MNIFNVKAIIFSGLFLGLAQTSATGFTLDAFTSYEGSNTFQSVQLPQFTGNGTTRLVTQSSLDSTVFGGVRTLQLTKLDNVFTPNQASLSSFNGIASLSTPEYKNRAEIIWDGWDGSGNFRNIELDGANVQDSFKIEINLLNLGTGDGDLSLNFEIRDTSNNSATITKNFTNNINDTQAVYFPYSTRVQNPSNTNNVSLANIDYIRFYTSDENIGDDFTFDLLQTDREVPFEFTPSLGLILGGSLFGFLRLQKRLKASKINN